MWNVSGISKYFEAYLRSCFVASAAVSLSACNLLSTSSSVDSNFTPGVSTTTVVAASSSAIVPLISFTSPTNGSYVNAAADSAAFAILGNCDQTGQLVTVKLDGATIATPVCNGVTFNATMNTTVLAISAHTLTASVTNSNGTSTATAAFTRDLTAPAAPATALGWVQASPFNIPTATWTLSTALDIANQKMQFYTGAGCGVAVGGLYDVASATATTVNWTAGIDATVYSYKVVTFDAAGNGNTSACSTAITIDSTAPAVSLTNLAGGNVLKGGATQAITWTAADANLGATPITLKYSTNGGSTWTTIAAGLANSGTYSWTVPSITSSTCKVQVTATDSATNSASSASAANFLIDSAPPVITTGSFSINGGATSLTNNNVTVAIQATDSGGSTISHLCLKTSLAAVTAGDACWVAMTTVQPGYTPATSINVTAYNFNIGMAGGAYNIYAYVKDSVGNFSSLTNAGAGTVNTDKYSLTYTPGVPPTLSQLNATNQNGSAYPPAAADLMVNAGQDLYIKWNAADDNAIPAGAITLYYTLNDSTYTQIATGLNDGANNGAGGETCTTAGGYTGCYVWSHTMGTPPPVLTYFRVRVKITDSNGYITTATATPNNVSGTFNFIAGNTDPGLGASAKSAAIYAQVIGSEAAQHTFAVASDGTLYYLDINNNAALLKVNPVDGTITKVASITGVQTGDGGPITSATFQAPWKLAVDYTDRLLILDNDRIRRYDPSTGIISTFIGGGASKAEGTAPLAFQITAPNTISANTNPFFPMPNGDFIFIADSYTANVQGGYKLSRYQASSNQIFSINFTGLGTHLNATDDITYCNPYGTGFGFDTNTSVFNAIQYGGGANGANCVNGGYSYMNTSAISSSPETYTTCTTGGCHNGAVNGNSYTAIRMTGLDGNMYAYGHRWGFIYKFNASTSTWSLIAGNSAPGQCADGTVATSCSIDPYAMFVNAQGTVFFLDRNRFRMIDENGKVQTLYGQSFAYGDGGSALSARFNNIKVLERRTDNGSFVTLDVNEYRMREFSPGGNISTIAGNGTNSYQAAGAVATSTYMSVIDVNGDFTIDPSNGDVFYVRDAIYLYKLTRSNGLWNIFVGNFAGTTYTLADGMIGTNISMSGAAPNTGYRDAAFLGFNTTNNRALVSQFKYNTAGGVTPWNSQMLKLFDRTTGTQTHLAGTTGICPGATSTNPTWCADGTAGSACLLPYGVESFIRRATYEPTTAKWYLLGYSGDIKTLVEGGSVSTLYTIPGGAGIAVASTVNYNGTNLDTFYCKNDGKIHKLTTQTNGTFISDVALTWPVAAMSCTGRSIIYEGGGTPKITFIYKLNGLQGVAQYLNP